MEAPAVLSYDEKHNLLSWKKERVKCTNDLFYLTKHVLGYDELNDTFHRPLCNAVQKYEDRWQFHLHARGHFKSTILTIADPIRLTLKHPNLRFLITNAVESKAKSFLNEMQTHFVKNGKFQERFPEHIPKTKRGEGNSQEFTTPARTKLHVREPTFSISGIASAVVSSHYDYIIFDDVVNDENSDTAAQRAKVLKKYREYLSLLDPSQRWPFGMVRLVGTRWHYYELYGQIIEQEKKRQQLNQARKYVMFRTTAYEGDKRSGSPRFKERFTTEHLQNLYEEQGAYIHSCQYLNDPQPDEEKIFDTKDVVVVPRPRRTMETSFNVYSSCDPAISSKESDDPTVILTIKVNSFGEIFITRIDRAMWNPDQLIENAIQVHLADKPKKFGFESVAFQKVLKFFLDKEIKKRNLRIEVEEIKRSTHVSKVARIQLLQPFVRAQKIFYVGSKDDVEYKQLISELEEFPYGRFDDVLDALADCVEMHRVPKKRKNDGEQKFVSISNGGSPYRTGYHFLQGGEQPLDSRYG